MENIKEDSEVKAVVHDIMHDFSTATDLACIYVGLNGNAQSEKFHFSNFCQFIRRIPALKMRCKHCDMCGGLESLKQQNCLPYVCHAGLVDFAVPIIRAKQLHGFIISGQIQCEDASIPYLQQPSSLEEYTDVHKYRTQLAKYTYKDILSAARILNVVTSSYFPFKEGLIYGESFEAAEQNVAKLNTPQLNRPEIKKALEYIKNNLAADLSLRKISSEVYLSESYLSRLFKQEMNTNIINYINQCRISEAERLLLGTKETIEVISRKLGFKRPSYFCKIFRKELGDTPLAYRHKQKLNNQNN